MNINYLLDLDIVNISPSVWYPQLEADWPRNTFCWVVLSIRWGDRHDLERCLEHSKYSKINVTGLLSQHREGWGSWAQGQPGLCSENLMFLQQQKNVMQPKDMQETNLGRMLYCPMNMKAPVSLQAWDRNKNGDRVDFCRQQRDHHLLEYETLSTGIQMSKRL